MEISQEEKEAKFKELYDSLEKEVWCRELDIEPWAITKEHVEPILSSLSPLELSSLEEFIGSLD